MSFPSPGISSETWSALSAKERARIEQAMHELAKVKGLAQADFRADTSRAYGEDRPGWEAVEPPVRAYYLNRAFAIARPVSLTPEDLEGERPGVVETILALHRHRQDRASRIVRKATKYVLRGLFAAFAALVLWLAVTAPLSQSLQPIAAPSFLVLAADGQPIARRGAVRGAPVDVMKLPPYVGQAFIAIEDRRFFQHVGIDPWSIGRAFVRNWQAGRVREGGSTISQQLAKTSFTGGERTWGRKAQEALITLWLEARLSKEEILSRYLSNVYFGNNIYGLSAAARFYFNTDPQRLTLAQAAMLAGLVNAPNRLAPNRNLAGARQRARLVLRAMAEIGFLSEAELGRARPARLRLAPGDNVPTGTYFADWILSGVQNADQEEYGERRIATTLERRLQRAAIRAFRNAGISSRQAALVAMRTDGRVVAMLGGRDYARSPFNRATMGRRQSGSTFKLFVYLAALRAGMDPDSTIADRPITIGGWMPRNASGVYRGEIPLREAFAQSSNVAAVRLAQRVGLDNVIQAARDLGVTAPIPRDDPSIALGTSDVSLLEMTAAYAAVAAGRYPLPPRGLAEQAEDQGLLAGIFRRQPAPRPDRAFGDMRALLNHAVDRGTGRAAALPVVTFGKTGTTQDSRDALFIGFAGDLVVGIWVGNDDNSPMRGVTGGGLPARIWRGFMVDALNLPARPPKPPAEDEGEEDIGDMIARVLRRIGLTD
ncbi:MAG TPA: transglycosylase domain-containing protein [Allosphingosinicella sp.]|nr:transglycosylase domain-containing protein [Allosphingosinicella sp.]